eukprot:3306185-Pyramimonas_sp.AAC.1
MSMRYFRLGDICMEQKRGIPIGGPLSGVILHVVLSEQEWHCDSKWSTRRRRLCAGRYVDDVLLFSNRYCHGCLSVIMSEVYSGIVKFNIEPEKKPLNCGTVVVSYLEVDLHISYSGVRVLMIHKNEAYALTGDPKYYKKKSLPLYLGTLTTRVLGELRGELRGRIH